MKQHALILFWVAEANLVLWVVVVGSVIGIKQADDADMLMHHKYFCYAGASADLGPEAEWVSFGPFPMFPEREIAPGTFLITFTDLSILQNSSRFYKIAGP